LSNVATVSFISLPLDILGCSLQALAKIKEQRAIAAAARQKSAEIKAGMDIFSIPQPPYKELGSMEADIERLNAIWTIISEWETSYNTWKQSKFREIQVLCFLLAS
jgi:hypothetical protein